MNDLTLICELCGQTIPPETGCLYVLHSDINRAGRDVAFEASWRTGHFSHPVVKAASAYAIGASEFRNWAHVARWTGHLMTKDWFTHTDWDELMRELSGETTAKRVRVNAKAAA